MFCDPKPGKGRRGIKYDFCLIGRVAFPGKFGVWHGSREVSLRGRGIM